MREQHGLTKHPLYRKWQDMKNRCYNKKVDRYKSYGANGITVCDEWKNSFTAFYQWSIENGWFEGLTIERKILSKEYSPDNCEYITMQEQAYNKSTTLLVTYESRTYCLADICKRLGFDANKYKLIWWHINKGKKFEDIIKRIL